MLRRLIAEWSAIALLVALVVVACVQGRFAAPIDDRLYDALVGLDAPPPSDRILIVAIDDASIAAIGRWPWRRAVHAAALRRLGAARPAAIGYDVLFTEQGDAGDDRALVAALAATPASLPALFVVPGSDGRAIDVVPPIAPLSSAARVGHVAVVAGDDAAARAMLLWVDAGGRRWVHLAEQTYRLATSHPSPAYLRAERTGDPAVIVPYQGEAGRFRTIPFSALLDGSAAPALSRGRIVLIGATAGGLGDRHRAPIRGGGTLPGIEIQANLLNALLADRLVTAVPEPLRSLASLVPALLLLLAFWWLTPNRAIAAALTVAAATLAGVAAALLVGGWWLPPGAALIGVALAYPLWSWRRLHAADRAMAGQLLLFADDPGAAPDAAGRAAGRGGLLDPIGRRMLRVDDSIRRLRDLRQLIHDTVEGVADPLIVTTLDDRVLLANTAAVALFGDLVGGSAPPESATTDTMEHVDGRVFSPRRAPLSDAGGRQRGWVLLLADVTQIRAAERDREQALEFLSHDMRAPQASIITLIEATAPTGLTPPLARRIAAHARRTLALADDFVQLARLRATGFAPEPIDLADVLVEAADELWAESSRRGIRIEVTAPPETAIVAGEQFALVRSLINLLDNAVRWSPDGGVIRCTLAIADAAAVVEIVDQGPGVAAALRDTLFTRFGAGGPGGGARSAGLGLAFVAATAARHGGGIVHRAGTGGGAVFALTLPTIDAALPEDVGSEAGDGGLG